MAQDKVGSGKVKEAKAKAAKLTKDATDKYNGKVGPLEKKAAETAKAVASKKAELADLTAKGKPAPSAQRVTNVKADLAKAVEADKKAADALKKAAGENSKIVASAKSEAEEAQQAAQKAAETAKATKAADKAVADLEAKIVAAEKELSAIR